MLDTIAPKAPDPLLKVMKSFREDPRAGKIDLGVGVYRNERGETPVMEAVKQAERRLLATQTTKAYVGQQGDIDFVRLMAELVFGVSAPDMTGIQAIGGTGALRLGCDLLAASGARRVLLPTPSWPNHPAVIAAAGLERVDVPFFHVAQQRIDIGALLVGIAQLDPGDAIILQACCHNPLGADFSHAQWAALADVIEARGAIAFLDLAYQGFGDGADADVAGLRLVLERVSNGIAAVTASKNFGLYRERVGALYVKAASEARASVLSNLFAIARANYSMPPDHGAACVRTVLSDPELTAIWRAELDAMRAHVKRTRTALAAARVNTAPMHLIADQKGMFSTLPLSPAQIATLRDTHGVYMTDSGRINVAGLHATDIPRFLDALAAIADI